MSSEKFPNRQTSQLLKGRCSQSNSTYFVTFCTKSRKRSLTTLETIAASQNLALEIQNSGDWKLHFLTVMPDHIHLLFTIGAGLPLQQLIGKYKSLLKRADASRSIFWQTNFFDHRVCDPEEFESIGFYMFMNPYKNGLIPLETDWEGHYFPDSARFSFLSGCKETRIPRPEWMGANLTNPTRLVTVADKQRPYIL